MCWITDRELTEIDGERDRGYALETALRGGMPALRALLADEGILEPAAEDVADVLDEAAGYLATYSPRDLAERPSVALAALGLVAITLTALALTATRAGISVPAIPVPVAA